MLVAFSLYLLLKNINYKRSSLRYFLSLLALAICFALPVLTFLLVYQGDETSLATESITLSASDSVSVASISHASSTFEILEFIPLLSIIWMSGVVLFSISLLLEMRKVYKLPRTGIIKTNHKLELIFERLIQQLQVKKVARLVISKNVDVPMVVGWLKPVVLLPLSMSLGLPAKQLEMLLAHELAHIKRYDYLVNFIQTLVEVLFFFHPCISWVSKQIRAEREYCCDDLAIHHSGNALAYANALTDAELLRPHNIPQLAMAATGSNLKKRIFRVVGHQTCAPKYSSQWLVSFFSLVLVGSILGVSQVSGIVQTETATNTNASLEANSAVLEPIKTTPKTRKQALAANKPELVEIKKLEKTNNSPIVKQKKIASQKYMETKAKTKVIAKVKTKPSVNKVNNDMALKTVGVQKQQLVKLKPAKQAEPKKSPVISEPSLIERKKKALKVASLDIQSTKKVDPLKPEISNPALLSGELPYYPAYANSKKMAGVVKVSYLVTREGKVREITFHNRIHRSFKKNIKRALRKWKYSPATLEGKKVDKRITMIFDFTEPTGKATATTGTRIIR